MPINEIVVNVNYQTQHFHPPSLHQKLTEKNHGWGGGALWNVVYPSLVGRHRYRLEDGGKGTFGRAEGARDGASDTSTASGASSGLLKMCQCLVIAHDDKK